MFELLATCRAHSVSATRKGNHHSRFIADEANVDTLCLRAMAMQQQQQRSWVMPTCAGKFVQSS